MLTATIILALLTLLVATEPNPDEAAAPKMETSLAPRVNLRRGPADRMGQPVQAVAKAAPTLNQISKPA